MTRRRTLAATLTALLVAAGLTTSAVGADPNRGPAPTASLDGRGNNQRHPSWGQAGQPYRRLAAADYADGVSAMVDGPDPRYVSNRIFNDTGQNLFSARGVSQWGWAWGQFLDHAMGLAEAGTTDASLGFDAADPLEEFTNDFGAIQFTRDAFANGTGSSTPAEQINTVSSYLDAWNVYGGSAERLEWLRVGPVDGNLANNGAKLLLDADGFLPRGADRGNAASAPEMQLMGRLTGTTGVAAIAGDVRANENIALTAIHTLFAREHNRIVDRLPRSLGAQRRFDIARRVVMAEEQYITYHEFLPALGIPLSPYRGYDGRVNPTLSNEFATVGYRAHSMIHGEFELAFDGGDVSADVLDDLEAQGAEVEDGGDEVDVAVPLHIAFGNPDLLEAVGPESVLAGLGEEAQYANDEQMDNQLRSVLFQVPGPGVTDPSQCADQDDLTQCFDGVVDLGAIDIQRGRDHGMPTYNDLRAAYGLPRVHSFTEITGEPTESMPAGLGIDDPDILDIVQLRDGDGTVLTPGSDEAAEGAVRAIRRTTLAARLKAIYGSVDEVDAFVGMVAERHRTGSEFGPLQQAIWQRQFTALRDGDRFFYANDPALRQIREQYGIDFRVSLGRVIAANTDLVRSDLATNVFFAPTD